MLDLIPSRKSPILRTLQCINHARTAVPAIAEESMLGERGLLTNVRLSFQKAMKNISGYFTLFLEGNSKLQILVVNDMLPFCVDYETPVGEGWGKDEFWPQHPSNLNWLMVTDPVRTRDSVATCERVWVKKQAKQWGDNPAMQGVIVRRITEAREVNHTGGGVETSRRMRASQYSKRRHVNERKTAERETADPDKGERCRQTGANLADGNRRGNLSIVDRQKR
ncbi:hypothetical protein BS47DRAFT_1363561 [Hydnum rufescens UP504]|uniref:Uncharacterized protein n=1 Tax=Hydnum rufescens UP504 TaxID=1448309 RepID=A0A9P6DUM5_9AGAM|nr:hypothetical protein BS47DRAFT_1363561 [Hydnum rufescens UP504]